MAMYSPGMNPRPATACNAAKTNVAILMGPCLFRTAG
jgi:hypothetical protein